MLWTPVPRTLTPARTLPRSPPIPRTTPLWSRLWKEKGYEILSDDLAMVPMTTTRLTDPDQLKAMGKLLDALEENDDVQNVWHSLENEEDLPE